MYCSYVYMYASAYRIHGTEGTTFVGGPSLCVYTDVYVGLYVRYVRRA